jgi:hypothetical protein
MAVSAATDGGWPLTAKWQPKNPRKAQWITALGPNDGQAYPFFNAFNFHQTPVRPVHMIYRKWPRDAYHVSLAEGRDDT